MQRLAIQCNILITKSYYEDTIEEKEIIRLLKQIKDGMHSTNKLLFIAARYALNLLVIAHKLNDEFARQLVNEYSIIELINQGIKQNLMGSGQINQQLIYLENSIPSLDLKSKCKIPLTIYPVTGKRKEFIDSYGLNPFYFCTWL